MFLFDFLLPTVLPNLSFTSLPRAWAPSLPPLEECQREALGVQWDSPSAEGSWLSTGAASAAHRWTGAAGSPAAQKVPAEQSRERRWQNGAHPGWRLGRKCGIERGEGASWAALEQDKVILACHPA